jgi:hypothetical protein
MPSLTLLDGAEVTAQERAQASALFSDQPAQSAASNATVSAPSTSTADAIFGEELNEQLMIQEQISAKRKEEEEKRCVWLCASGRIAVVVSCVLCRQRDKVAIAAMKNSAPQPTWLSNPMTTVDTPPPSNNSALCKLLHTLIQRILC